MLQRERPRLGFLGPGDIVFQIATSISLMIGLWVNLKGLWMTCHPRAMDPATVDSEMLENILWLAPFAAVSVLWGVVSLLSVRRQQAEAAETSKRAGRAEELLEEAAKSLLDKDAWKRIWPERTSPPAWIQSVQSRS